MQRRRFLRLLALAAGGWVVGPLRAAPIRVCAACGHEALGDETVCRHCGAALPPLPAEPPPEAPAPAPVAPPPAADPSALLKPGTADEEVRWAQQLADAGEGWGALLAARNAMALAALLNADGAKAMAAAAALAHDVRQRLFVVRRVCPVCDGSGKKKVQIVTLKGEVVEQELPALVCESCRGTGAWRARPLADEIARDEAGARRAYGVEQLRRGRVENLGIWLPRGVAEALDVRGLARMRRAFGLPCAACNGFGAIGCANCQGAGRIRCTNRNCVHGIEICPDCKGSGRASSAASGSGGAVLTRCPTCRGAGKRECPVCGGKGELPCGRCDGKGETLCAACRGAGESPECARCGGQGFSLCARCGGVGRQRDVPCAACAGQGVILCPNCQGFGRARRR